ncbi:RNA-directed DNA polymerase, eukaryota, reverse transcriptase zinc-binding domain protein [Tanacetum coccineum]
MTDQAILCCVETIQAKTKFFCSIVYAGNNVSERRKLWRDLEIHKRFAGHYSWVILGDFNVTLDVAEHAVAGNPKCNVLKKLDRIMINEEFSNQFQKAHGIFLPYMILDHSPAMLIIQDGYHVKKKAFKFSNFISKKKEFIDIVRKEWKDIVQGCHMYRLIKKLMKLKRPLNKLSWNEGNVYENVRKLKEELKKDKEAVDRNPFDVNARIKAAQTRTDLIDASNYEINLLHQKAKINWLKNGK